MPPAAAPTPKVCIRCGQDCSSKPRTKDPHGRYTCRPCFETLEAARQTAPPPAPAAVEEPEPEPLGLMDEGLPPGLIDESALPVATGLQVCPGCQSSMPYGSTICVQCGYDVQKKGKFAVDTAPLLAEGAKPARGGRCPKCGYSLKGLKEPRCPECGQIVGRETQRDKRAKESRETVKWAYLKPALILVGGLIGATVFYAARGEAALIVPHMMMLGILTVIGLVVFLACCLLWLGFDAPIHLLILQFASVFAVMGLVVPAVFLVPIGTVKIVGTLLIYALLMADALDLDIQDAVLVSVVTFVVCIFAMVWLATTMMPG